MPDEIELPDNTLSPEEKDKRIKELEQIVQNLTSNINLLKSSNSGSNAYIQEAESRIHLLEEILKGRIDGTESGKELVLRLHSGLQKAKEKITEQRKRIEDLTQEPFIIATILRLYKQEGKINYRKAHYTEFNEGSIVHINPEGPFSHHTSAKGLILSIEGSIASVKFEDGYENNYPVGEGSDALLLLDEKTTVLPKFSALVNLEGRKMELTVPEKLFPVLSPGGSVKLTQKMQIVDYYNPPQTGELATVLSVIDRSFCKVDFQGAKLKILLGKTNPEPGDTVLIDSSRTIILANLGKDNSKFSVDSLTPVSWDDIGGLREAKAQLLEAFITPSKQTKEYSFYSKKISKGALLLGGPGRGKTLLVRGLVNNLVEIHGPDFLEEGFAVIKGPEILTKYIGEPEAFLREVFTRLKSYSKRTGNRSYLFIDEAEAIGRKRGTGKSSDVEMTIVPTLLTEMDGLESSSVTVLMATNRADIMDPALTRDGRIDMKILVPMPPKEDALEIFKIHMRNSPLGVGLTLDALASFANEELFSGKYSFYEFSKAKGKKTEMFLFGLPNILNGAMIANIIENAKAFALRRDIENKTLTGLSEGDILKALSSTFEQNKLLNYEDDLKEFISLHELDIFSGKKFY